jgi:hypothetical protein
MNKNETINWFGKPMKKKAKSKSYSNTAVSYLGLGPKKVPQRINFFGFGKTKKYKMTPSYMFRKESTKKKRLSKWGDADMDGSLNYFDCDARNAFKDYEEDVNGNRPVIDAQTLINETKTNMPQESILAQTRARMRPGEIKRRREVYRRPIKAAFEKIETKVTIPIRKKVREKLGIEYEPAIKEYKKKPKFGKVGSAVYKRIKSGKVYSALGEEKKRAKEAAEERERKKEDYTSLYRQGKISEDEYNTQIEDIAEREAKEKAQAGKIAAVETHSEKIKSLLKIPGMAGTLGAATYAVEEKEARGKKPTQKELKALTKIERRIRKVGDIQQEGKISREILTKLPGGEIARVMTGAAVDKSGEYSKAVKAKAARVRRLTQKAAGLMFGPSLTQTSFNSEPRGRGRPAGPSGEYKIGGRPVYEAEFQQYSAKQNALNRMLPSGQQSSTLNPEYIAYMKAKAAEERGETQTVMTEDGMPMEGIPQAEGTGLPTTGTSMMQTGEQQVQLKEKRAYVRAAPDEVKQAQAMAEARDNILMAPNFMKGELKATGGSILTPIGPSILEAPQVFKGEMRNVVKPNPDEGIIKLGERPQTNPYGDEWLDIEIGSGKPVIRKRIRERWMSGEAL